LQPAGSGFKFAIISWGAFNLPGLFLNASAARKKRSLRGIKMLVRMHEILDEAYERGYGVGAFNLLSMEAVKGALRAAEALQLPIILQLAEVQLNDSPLELMIPMFLDAARRASVKVAVHYDHGLTFGNILKAIKLGCTSVMFDGASEPFEDNVRKTAEIAKIAHAFGADCEAELGTVGSEGQESLLSAGMFTDPAQALDFSERTECDFLAVAVGNVHGNYAAEPALQTDLIEQISGSVKKPLVLHGGSGISDAEFRKAISCGIAKINVCTAILNETNSRVKKLAEKKFKYSELSNVLEEAACSTIKRHMSVFSNR
jgi:fructose-bisphosphate aldolase class II